MTLPNEFVNWFRSSSPYIHAHRNKTFVIAFGGEAVLAADFEHHVHDFALLNSLGIRLVLVHGIRPQIDQRLPHSTPRFHKHLRITDDQALQCVKEAAGLVRVEIEALLSLGLANSPMAGAKIKVASGNFVTAKPLGVIDGIDYCHTGEVRRIDSEAIHQQLDQDNVVLISPIGYSPSGEIFNLSAEQVATAVAIALKAEKLVFLTEQDCLNPGNGEKIQQLTTNEVNDFLEKNPNLPETVSQPLKAAIHGCLSGIARVHLINRLQNGALLLELFTRDGIGTLISSTPFEELRPATLNDIGGILELIKPLEQQGILAKRSREKIEMEIADYFVIERDGLIIGCIALHVMLQCQSGVLACLAVHPEYRRSARANRLLDYASKKAKQQNLQKLFVLSTQTAHWFIERGFLSSDILDLPEPLKALYNPQRNSKVLCKNLD